MILKNLNPFFRIKNGYKPRNNCNNYNETPNVYQT